MSILIDHQIFFLNRYGGITRIFKEIINKLEKTKTDYIFPLIFSKNSNDIIIEKKSGENIYEISPFHLSSIIGRIIKSNKVLVPMILHRIESVFLTYTFQYRSRKMNNEIIQILNSKKVKVFHPTYFSDYYLDNIEDNKSKKIVITVFDCIHELFPFYFNSKDLVKKNRKRLLDRADTIIAISENTKKDLIHLYNITNHEKIKVVYLGGDLLTNSIDPPFSYNLDYILYVGNRRQYKNFENLIISLSDVLPKRKVKLVCAGGGIFLPSEKEIIRKNGLENEVIFYPILNDIQLASLYKHAIFFIYPSKYEGFGVPLVEAMNFNCPIVCSNTSSFPEVVQDAAEMFEPLNIDSMKNVIENVLLSPSLRINMRKKGNIRAKFFSWNKCSDRHLEIYKQLRDA
jgi:glycosyltransferase involved in cell wall biosynthesis